jgi:DNA-binding transcriptional regulator YhcF (GntR family)
MLSSLFGSPARVKILNTFLRQPDEQYYLRQLARDLELQVNSVRRELINLEELGLILLAEHSTETKAKEKKYYTVNKNFVIFPELKALFAKSQILNIQEFAENVQKIYTPKLLILTGFFMDEDNAKTDILIVGKINKEKFLKTIKELETVINREVNYTIMDEKEYIYRREVLDIFLNRIMEGRKMVVSDFLSDSN